MPTLVRKDARGAPALDARRLRRVAEAMLRALELEDAELSVLLTRDPQIQALNRDHRGKDKPTDVLAFPLDLEDELAAPKPKRGAAPPPGPALLGDVVISLDTADRQARSRKRDLFSEVRFLLAHGMLHLIGYDHGSPTEKREMDRMTRRLVRSVSEL